MVDQRLQALYTPVAATREQKSSVVIVIGKLDSFRADGRTHRLSYCGFHTEKSPDVNLASPDSLLRRSQTRFTVGFTNSLII